ncbi:MAG: hypothetical protein IJS07_07010 [Bacteroidales bacterium]|nr:hypothetical protein [Bacteroidales bacterium]
MKRIVLLLALVALCVSCEHHRGFESSLLKSETECLRVSGTDIFVYDPLTCQLGYNAALREYRVGTDTMSDYFSVRLSENPREEGQLIDKCQLEWTTPDDMRTMKNLTFEVKKLDEQGRVWLWCKSSKVFVLVRGLQ